ncbi:PAS domain S-box-containing protein [Polaribacter sp. KT25b]|uniref:PAS domain-containing protein n=1 Tax=Polaribacter sp. KT25b TaxID=1855336 RepID=UPI00087D7EA6|nr:PAS domain-containing protein [Polaribacter sp. KT25b]SDS23968.1 PAS domain S-box-containing protein [Polaribacter sp. KT25b]
MNENIENIALLQKIFNASHQGILVINNADFIINANAKCQKMFGYNADEILEKKIETLIPEKIKKTIKKQREKFEQKPKLDGINLNLNSIGVKKNGSAFPIEINLSLTTLNNKPIVIVFLIDNTKQQSDKQKLAISEFRKAEAQRLAHVANWSWNLKTDERNWSDEFYRIYGLTPGDERLNNKTVLSFTHPDDRKKTLKEIDNAIKSYKPYKYQKRIIRPNGEIRYIIAKGKILFDEDSNPKEMYGTIQDITKHKKIEYKLKSSQEKNQAILEALPDLMVLYDKNGNYLEIHSSEGDELAIAYNENIGQNIDKILPKDVCEKIRKSFDNCEKTKKTQIIEYSLSIKDKLKHIEARIVQTDEGNFLSIIRNITKSKNVEKFILEKEQRLRLTLEAGEFGSWDWNLITNKIERDRYQNSLFGIKNNENTATYESFLNKIHPEDKERVKRTILEAIKKTKNYTLEYRVIHADSSIHWLHEKGKIFKNNHGKPIRIIGVTNNITKQKKAEEKLIESEEKLRNYTIKLEEKVTERTKELTTTVQKLVESNLNLEDQILITDEAERSALTSKLLLTNISKNFPRGLIMVVNENYCIDYIEGEELDKMEMRGVVVDGTKIDKIQVFSEERKTRLKENIKKTLSGKHLSFEIEFKGIPYLVNTTPLFNNEKIIKRALLVYNNIFEQKQVEIDILNTLKKERELSELKSRFISMASHEFRTPLSAILSSAILIEKQNGVGKEDKRINYVSKIRSNVKDLVVILNDFLSLGKLQEGKVVAQPTTFNLIDFLKLLIEEINNIKKNGQIITLQYENSIIKVVLDPKLLKHIIHNLLSNAIKYSEENQEIIIKVTPNNKLVNIKIIDQGIGIPQEDQANMFQRFYRADNAANIQGTGLGLNIVKQYTDLMDGTINFKSELNKGSTFYLEFPLKEKKDEKNIIN